MTKNSPAPVGANDTAPSSDQIVLWGVNDDASCRCPKGFDCPIKNRGKHPKIGRDGALLPYEPGDKLGNLTGREHGRIVVDVDVRSGDGWGSLLALPGFDVNDLEKTRFVRTATQGGHIYFAHPDFTVGNGKLAPHVDVRGDAEVWAYVVAPGSRVVLDDGTVGTHALEVDVPPAPCPEWLLAALLARGAKKSAVEVEPIDESHRDWEYRLRLGEDACKTSEPSRGDGEASAKLMALTGYLKSALRLPLDIAGDLIEEHFNPQCTKPDGSPWPWDREEINRALKNARAEHREVLYESTEKGIDSIGARQRARQLEALKETVAEYVAREQDPEVAREEGAAAIAWTLERGDSVELAEMVRSVVPGLVFTEGAFFLYDDAQGIWASDGLEKRLKSLVRSMAGTPIGKNVLKLNAPAIDTRCRRSATWWRTRRSSQAPRAALRARTASSGSPRRGSSCSRMRASTVPGWRIRHIYFNDSRFILCGPGNALLVSDGVGVGGVQAT